MDKEFLSNEIRVTAESYFSSKGQELVEIICRYEGRDLFLRVLADRPEGGITLEECAAANKDLGFIFDEKNIIPQRYILEVSSPGLDRPLTLLNDFRRCLNKEVKVFLREPVEGKIEWDGIIIKAQDDIVSIDVKGKTMELPIQNINKAKQLI